MRFGTSGKVAFASVMMPMLAVLAACSSDNSAKSGGGPSGSIEPSSGGGQTGTGTATAGGSSSGTGGASAPAPTATAGNSSSSGSGLSSGGGVTTSPPSSGGSSSGAGTNSVGGSSSSGGGTGTGSSSGAGTSGGATGNDAGGGGPGTAPSGDAGAGGPSLCTQTLAAGATLCDGFEGAAPGATGSDWTVSAMGADTAAVDTTKFYRGSKSVKVTATNMAFIVETKTFTGTTAATNNAFWGRYFILSGVTAAASWPQGHVVFGALADSMNSGDQFHFAGGSRGKLEAEIRVTGDSYTDSMKMPAAADPAFPIASDGWQCWEWHVTADNSYDFYINGTEVPEMKVVSGKATMSGNSFAGMPIFGQLDIGWQSFSGGTAETVWVDEVALGPNQIGCGN